MQIRHLKEAVADARREYLFWQKQRAGLEKEFAEEFEAAIRAISLSPDGYVRVSKKTGASPLLRKTVPHANYLRTPAGRKPPANRSRLQRPHESLPVRSGRMILLPSTAFGA
ncbi:hypothetical protein J3R74_000526 [Puniceicoccus vermicola]